MSQSLPAPEPSEQNEQHAASCATALIVSASVKLVRKLLNKAATRWKEDDEHVHQLRVATRRALAAVDLFEPLLPDKECRWLNRNLKHILRAAGKARDLDVLLKNGIPKSSAALPSLQAFWKKNRRTCQESLHSLNRTKRGKLKKHSVAVSKLPCADPIPTDTVPQWSNMRRWIRHRLSKCSQGFLKHLADASDVESMHQLRIETKRLRYTLEIVRPALNTAEAESLKTLLSELQDVLGTLNDHVVTLRYLKRSATSLDTPSDKQAIASLIEARTAKIAAQRESFRIWLDSPAPEDLRRQLVSCLAGTI
ncbi:MAG: CHAD domain-containing protein [Planctomycetota bacterium]